MQLAGGLAISLFACGHGGLRACEGRRLREKKSNHQPEQSAGSTGWSWGQWGAMHTEGLIPLGWAINTTHLTHRLPLPLADTLTYTLSCVLTHLHTCAYTHTHTHICFHLHILHLVSETLTYHWHLHPHARSLTDTHIPSQATSSGSGALGVVGFLAAGREAGVWICLPAPISSVTWGKSSL